MPVASVVLPTYNRLPQLEKTLGGLAEQTVSLSDIEVIVVSDGSSDGTDDYLASGRAPIEVTFVSQENAGPAAARNHGIDRATGDLVVFLDDDVVPLPECLAVHIEAHENSSTPLVVIGPLLTPESWELEPWVEWEQRMLYKQYDAMLRGDWAPTYRQFYTGNASVERDHLTKAGGFDPSFRRAEDVELARRLHGLGLEFLFTMEARAYHYAQRSYGSWLENAKAYARADLAMSHQDGDAMGILRRIRREHRRRNLLTQIYCGMGMRVPGVARLGEAVASPVAEQLQRRGMGGAGQRVLSAVYNLAYQRSLAHELDRTP